MNNVPKLALQRRLRFWGVVLLLLGLMTITLNMAFFLQGQMPIGSAFFVGWGLILLVVAILDLVKNSIGMLILTGVVTIIHGFFAFYSGGFIWGLISFVAGIITLRDSSKIKRQKNELEPLKKSHIEVFSEKSPRASSEMSNT